MRNTSDADLVRRYLDDGDQSAFAVIYERYEPKIRGYLRPRVWDADALDDVVQITFIKCAESLGRLSDPNVLKSWLHQIAMNAAKDWAKSQCGTKKGQTRLATDVWGHIQGGCGDGQQCEGLETHAIVEDDLSLHDEREHLRWLVLHLPRKYRRIAQLYWLEDKSLKEVAEIEGITAHNVQTRSDYARRLLRQHLSGKRRLNLEVVDFGVEPIGVEAVESLVSEAKQEDRAALHALLNGEVTPQSREIFRGLIETSQGHPSSC